MLDKSSSSNGLGPVNRIKPVGFAPGGLFTFISLKAPTVLPSGVAQAQHHDCIIITRSRRFPNDDAGSA